MQGRLPEGAAERPSDRRGPARRPQPGRPEIRRRLSRHSTRRSRLVSPLKRPCLPTDRSSFVIAFRQGCSVVNDVRHHRITDLPDLEPLSRRTRIAHPTIIFTTLTVARCAQAGQQERSQVWSKSFDPYGPPPS